MYIYIYIYRGHTCHNLPPSEINGGLFWLFLLTQKGDTYFTELAERVECGNCGGVCVRMCVYIYIYLFICIYIYIYIYIYIEDVVHREVPPRQGAWLELRGLPGQGT